MIDRMIELMESPDYSVNQSVIQFNRHLNILPRPVTLVAVNIGDLVDNIQSFGYFSINGITAIKLGSSSYGFIDLFLFSGILCGKR